MFDCCFTTSSPPLGFPDPGTPILLARRITEGNLGNAPFWRQPITHFSKCFALFTSLILSPVAGVATGVHPLHLSCFCLSFVCRQKFFKSCQINSHICLGARDRLEACFSVVLHCVLAWFHCFKGPATNHPEHQQQPHPLPFQRSFVQIKQADES